MTSPELLDDTDDVDDELTLELDNDELLDELDELDELDDELELEDEIDEDELLLNDELELEDTELEEDEDEDKLDLELELELLDDFDELEELELDILEELELEKKSSAYSCPGTASTRTSSSITTEIGRASVTLDWIVAFTVLIPVAPNMTPDPARPDPS
jgi:hypothetical protein